MILKYSKRQPNVWYEYFGSWQHGGYWRCLRRKMHRGQRVFLRLSTDTKISVRRHLFRRRFYRAPSPADAKRRISVCARVDVGSHKPRIMEANAQPTPGLLTASNLSSLYPPTSAAGLPNSDALCFCALANFRRHGRWTSLTIRIRWLSGRVHSDNPKASLNCVRCQAAHRESNQFGPGTDSLVHMTIRKAWLLFLSQCQHRRIWRYNKAIVWSINKMRLIKVPEVGIACDWEYHFWTFCITLQRVEKSSERIFMLVCACKRIDVTTTRHRLA